MNDKPHTHEVAIRTYGSIAVEVKYGDTEKVLLPVFGKVSERSIRRAVRKVIRQHDRGSVKAGRQQRTLATIEAEANARLADAKWPA